MSNPFANALDRLASAINQYLSTRTAPSATQADTLAGKDPTSYPAAVTKTDLSLGQVDNFPYATQAQALAGVDQASLMTPALAAALVAKHYTIKDTTPGGVLLGMDADGVRTDRLCRRLNIVADATEYNTVVNYRESFANVFNNWTRFSHSGASYPADATELSAWSYDNANDKIVCTKNSNTFIGFISPEAFDHYTLEVELSSTNSDDDTIGVCVAFAISGGKQYTLNLVRQFNGSLAAGASFAALYNFLQPDSITLNYNDAGLATPNPYHNTNGTSKNGWVGASPVRIKVVRTGDLIECWTTLPGSTAYIEAKKITLDLSKIDELKVFRGPQRFGYVCQSQLNASWRSIQRPGAYVPIIRLDTKEAWEYVNNAWVKQVDGYYQTLLQPQRLYTNQVTGRLWATTEDPKVVLAINKRSS